MNIKTNSKEVKKNDIFICIHDQYEDRHKYIKDIKEASAIIIDKNINKKIAVPLIKVNNTNDTLFQIYNDYYENPLLELNIFAVTGTDGKTTTASIIKQLISNYNKIAYLGTNGFNYYNYNIKTKNTTPDIGTTLKYAKILKDNNIKNLVMEASSEGLLHNRCKNLKFKRALITNVTGDHLNIHKTFDNYLKSKLKLFTYLSKDGLGIINTDDISYNYIKNMKIKFISYGTKKNADYRILNIKTYNNKTCFSIKHKNKTYNICSPLLGKFNVYNLTASIALVHSLGIDIESIIKNIKKIKPIPGRMNIFKTKKEASVILDYAHTSHATKEILKFAKSTNPKKIITILGSAGGREKEKRKEIGKIATSLSDKVIFTTDDPRYEKVSNIINDMLLEVKTKNYTIIKNRKHAIKNAIKDANKGDLILILGKGTDNYMAIRNKYKKYNDLNIIKKYT